MTENELRKQVVLTMQSWLGRNELDGSHHHIVDIYNGHRPLPRSYRMPYNQPWCATTVSAAAIENGCTSIIPCECSCGEQVKLFQQMGRWVEADGYVPKPADVIYWAWKDNGVGDCALWPDHVGIVERVTGSTIMVIEGNKGKAVDRRCVPIGARYIRGFGVPDYKAKAASFSVFFLAQLGVLTSLNYWLEVLAKKQIKYVDDLISKAASSIRYVGPRADTVEEAVAQLVASGVITSPDYWKNQTGNTGELLKALGGCMYA